MRSAPAGTIEANDEGHLAMAFVRLQSVSSPAQTAGATIPTVWLEAGQSWRAPGDEEWVIKPAVSICSLDTGRYRLDDREQRGLALAHVARPQSAGRSIMVQPYMHDIDSQGERSLVFFGGVFSHAVRKPAVLSGPEDGADRRFAGAGAQLQVHTPMQAELAVADSALCAAPFEPADLLYARVDVLSSSSGVVLIELELTEPQLYLGMGTAVERFAALIASRAAGGVSDS
jgi:hypothetical protein